MTTSMLMEIHEQPEVLARTIAQASSAAGLPQGIRRICLLARGTSAHAAMYARYLYAARFGIHAEIMPPSLVTHYAPPLDLSDTLVIAVSQSGATQEIVDGVLWAQGRGAATMAVTNVLGSPLTRVADDCFVTPAGIELAVPATKSHTAQAVALGVLAAHHAGARVDEELLRVPDVAARFVEERDAAHRIATLIAASAGGTIVVGRGYTHGTALEVGLKLEETCLQPVRALSYADLRHGPFAVLDESRVALVVAPGDGPLLEGFRSLVRDITATGAKVVVIGGDAPLADLAHDSIAVAPGLAECWVSPLLAIPGQLIAHELGAIRGLDVDSPRNLTKIGLTDGAALA